MQMMVSYIKLSFPKCFGLYINLWPISLSRTVRLIKSDSTDLLAYFHGKRQQDFQGWYHPIAGKWGVLGN